MINSLTLTKSNWHGLSFDNSQIQTVSSVSISDFYTAINFYKCNISSFIDSTIQNCGQISLQKGGAVHLISSNITIDRTMFFNNSAVDGAAIYVDWTLTDFCFTQLKNVSFSNNVAVQSGGAIYYNYKRPEIQSCLFSNNSSAYGPNIASYAVKVYKVGYPTNNISLSDVGSGIKLNNPFLLVLADYDNQQMVLDNVSQLTIRSLSSSNKLSGVNVVKVDSGVADFSDLIFIGNPGSQNINFAVDSKSIDYTKINRLYGTNAFSNLISVSFRYWMPGEQMQNDKSYKFITL